MIKFLKKLWMLIEESTVDALIRYAGEDTVVVWNGMNLYGSFMFKKNDEFVDDPAKLPVLSIGFGIWESGYGDWGGGFSHQTCSVIKIYVDEDLHIVDKIWHDPYYNGPKPKRSYLRKMRKFFQKLKIGDDLDTVNVKLLDRLRQIFAMPIEERYAHYIRCEPLIDGK